MQTLVLIFFDLKYLLAVQFLAFCADADGADFLVILQGMSSTLNFDETLEKQISMSKILVVEGYLWELPETVEAIAKACQKAREQGVLVALTASDVSCVKRHRKKMW
jgi:sugar/nucleoside kinase (ribokinase family)